MLRVTNPATGAEIKKIKLDDRASIGDCFTRLRAHRQNRLLATRSARQEAMLAFADDLASHKEELASLLTSEVGKPIRQALGEISGTIERARYFAAELDRVGQDRVVFEKPGLTEEIRFEPLGMILCISAWNYPYFVSSNVILPALLAGCSVVFKPSELATLSGQKMAALLLKQEAFKDSLAVTVGGKEVGAMLVDLPFDGIFFTGSERAGFTIKAAINDRMILSQFEMGGKDAAYLCDDCDLKKSIASVVDGAFFNCGQGCCSVERLYLHERIALTAKRELEKAVRDLKVGDPHDSTTYIGPLTRREQIELLNAQVADAVKKGATIACGGKAMAGPGNFYEPTLIFDANRDMLVMQEESFGPIVAVEVVKDDHHALAEMNHSRFGLTGAVYTKDLGRAQAILEKLEVGSAYWNCCDRVSARLPWSGRKNSGHGVTSSTIGMEVFFRLKAWHNKAVP